MQRLCESECRRNMTGFVKTEDQERALAMLGGPEKNHFLYGGARSGKTMTLLYDILLRSLQAPGSRHAIFRLRTCSVRQAVLLDTFPKMMDLCFPDVKFKKSCRDGFVRLENGSELWFCGLDEKKRAEKILGKEFATVYFNECSEISYPAVTVAITRLAQKSKLLMREGFLPLKAFFDCNPPGKSHWSYKLFIQNVEPENNAALVFPEHYASMLMNPAGNRANLPDGYIEEILAGLPERKRQRFLEGLWLDDLEGALWQHEMIDRSRIINVPELQRIVIGVDPAVTSTPTSDETGIVVAGRDRKGEYYILSDASLRASPNQWGQAVFREYQKWKADRVICETNNGGDLVKDNLRNIHPAISCKDVKASRGKIIRAEPVAALYEQGKVHHVGIFRELEEQLCSYNPAMTQSSPDRLDALVWAISELSAESVEARMIMA